MSRLRFFLSSALATFFLFTILVSELVAGGITITPSKPSYRFDEQLSVSFNCHCPFPCGDATGMNDIYLRRQGWTREHMGRWQPLGNLRNGGPAPRTVTRNFNIPRDLAAANDYVVTVWSGDEACSGNSPPFAISQTGDLTPPPQSSDNRRQGPPGYTPAAMYDFRVLDFWIDDCQSRVKARARSSYTAYNGPMEFQLQLEGGGRVYNFNPTVNLPKDTNTEIDLGPAVITYPVTQCGVRATLTINPWRTIPEINANNNSATSLGLFIYQNACRLDDWMDLRIKAQQYRIWRGDVLTVYRDDFFYNDGSSVRPLLTIPFNRCSCSQTEPVIEVWQTVGRESTKIGEWTGIREFWRLPETTFINLGIDPVGSTLEVRINCGTTPARDARNTFSFDLNILYR